MVNNNIASVSLKKCSLPDGFLRYLSWGLAKNTKLRELDLSDNKFSPVGVKDLSNALALNHHLKLEKLDLSNNFIRDEGASMLATSIEINRSLENISVAGNDIADRGGQKLTEAIESNSVLCEFKS